MNDYNPTYDNDRKITSKWRNGRLDPASLSGKGFIGQQIVSQTYGVEDCNLKMENFNFYVDLNKITGYGYSESHNIFPWPIIVHTYKKECERHLALMDIDGILQT